MELSPIQWGLISFVIIVIALLLAHRYFLPFSLLPKEDPLDQRIAHDLPEAEPITTDPKKPLVVYVKTRPHASKESIDRLIAAENDPHSGFGARLDRLDALRALGDKNYRS
jgi:hypothetical protein